MTSTDDRLSRNAELAMNYEQFISSVEDAVGPADGPVTLRSLADRLSGVQARHVIVRLAPDPAPTPPPDGPVVHIDLDEYRPRVRERRQPERASSYRSAEVGVPTLLDVLGPEVHRKCRGLAVVSSAVSRWSILLRVGDSQTPATPAGTPSAQIPARPPSGRAGYRARYRAATARWASTARCSRIWPASPHG
jgi:hypothetical protein